MTEQTLTLLLGPIGLTVFLLYVAKLLWEDHRKSDERREQQLVDTTARLDLTITGWTDQTDATNKLTETIERRLAAPRPPRATKG